ncbi:MAG: hypothetical protein HOL15_09870 [Nitrospinaceae bacterium]|nr:hypothetical protein [Nitrospinaceae bacterium]
MINDTYGHDAGD